MSTLLQTSAGGSIRQPASSATGLSRLHIMAVEQVVGIGITRAQLMLSHWLVAVVQAPTGGSYTDLQAAFSIGAGWPLASFPAGYVLLGYLDPRDLAVI